MSPLAATSVDCDSSETAFVIRDNKLAGFSSLGIPGYDDNDLEPGHMRITFFRDADNLFGLQFLFQRARLVE